MQTNGRCRVKGDPIAMLQGHKTHGPMRILHWGTFFFRGVGTDCCCLLLLGPKGTASSLMMESNLLSALTVRLSDSNPNPVGAQCLHV